MARLTRKSDLQRQRDRRKRRWLAATRQRNAAEERFLEEVLGPWLIGKWNESPDLDWVTPTPGSRRERSLLRAARRRGLL